MEQAIVSQKFGEQGWRVTLAVRKLVEVLAGARGFLSAYELEEALNNQFDVTTVYRILEKLQTVKLAHELNGKWHWCADPHNHDEQHHFLICAHCGEADEIFLDYQGSIAEQLKAEKNFRLTQVHLAFLGVCAKCQQKGRA